MPVLRSNSDVDDARAGAAAYKAGLEPIRRKRLGQFFTGVPLGRILSSIALDPSALTVIDPMAGHGDLLDAVVERASGRGQRLACVQAVEIDPPTADMCRRRLDAWRTVLGDGLTVRQGNAFAIEDPNGYRHEGYDLVITNPPYVRYQALANGDATGAMPTGDDVRRALRIAVERRIDPAEWPIWRTLIDSYSGHADLSVPAWILSASLVRPGAVLALVAPATWRSRNYGDIVQYLLERCFRLECLVEDTQPGWFSDALVRTQLVVARRRRSEDARVPLVERGQSSSNVITVKVSPTASGRGSLMGGAFDDVDAEGRFADWIRGLTQGGNDSTRGLWWNVSSVADMSEAAFAAVRRRTWFESLEPRTSAGPLFDDARAVEPAGLLPATIKALLGEMPSATVALPEALGLSISQGLRTGCNGFFYVDLIQQPSQHRVRVRLSALFGNDELTVPDACLVPVVRRQSELHGPVDRLRLCGRVLDLSGWVLPEDAEPVERTRHLFVREGMPVPAVMPDALADFVRRAARTIYPSGSERTRIPDLSAVRTNVRVEESGRAPRFWYMLPTFARRHRPDAFIARVNQDVPSVQINDDPPALIDANFSTIWGDAAHWTRYAILALLNSAWCHACMEALGTPLGGGALKLEATHLKRLPLPVLMAPDLAILDAWGRAQLADPREHSPSIDGFIVAKIFGVDGNASRSRELVQSLRQAADEWCRARQRQVS